MKKTISICVALVLMFSLSLSCFALWSDRPSDASALATVNFTDGTSEKLTVWIDYTDLNTAQQGYNYVWYYYSPTLGHQRSTSMLNFTYPVDGTVYKKPTLSMYSAQYVQFLTCGVAGNSVVDHKVKYTTKQVKSVTDLSNGFSSSIWIPSGVSGYYIGPDGGYWQLNSNGEYLYVESLPATPAPTATPTATPAASTVPEQSATPTPTPAPSGGTDEDSPSHGILSIFTELWGMVRNLIKLVVSVIAAIIGGVLSILKSLVGIGTSFTKAFSSMFPFVPDSLIVTVGAGVSLMIGLAVIKFIRG